YIYGGRIPLAIYNILDIVKILVAANELSLQELIPHIQSFLIENNENWIEQNFNLIYQTSFENNTFLDLQKFCTKLISKHPEIIFNSSIFTSTPEKALISLIQHHDNHQMTEVQFGSMPSAKKIVDFKIIKNQHPTNKIVDSKIIKNQYPYKKIKYFDNPNNKSEPQLVKSYKNIDSIIITIQHVELISKWIDRLENTDELKNSYKFKLILRGSQDGFTAKRFHEICDDQSNTVTIIKVKDTNEILGGYNPIKWKSSNGYGITDDSFIFSFDKARVESYILSRVKNENYAINYWHHYGPSFGGGDLTIYEGREGEVSFSNKTSYCYYEDSYEKQIRKTKEYFSVEEYEVFQI
ncbi:TLD-domain-containing protein, partial [Rhizophagus diaphanus]